MGARDRRWLGRVSAICYAAALVGALATILGAGTRGEAVSGAVLALWVTGSWFQRCKIERLEANCGQEREADSTITTGGTTVRVWWRR